uniref:Mitochondrial potassium channel ATP-binding subunit n=1 Tax=Anas platyrhynchos platyrhynchos TaxID=8840 RepID=A0A493TJ99_ANAPP
LRFGPAAPRTSARSYPTRPGHPVLRDFSLSLPPGKTVAIVGPSGGGKSTVAALLERFYEPTQGSITLDGHDISSLDPSWLRGQVIGFISQPCPQDPPGASDEEVYAAARLANADDFIRSFPEGYGTVVGERGTALSGGQRQRIAIARALLKDPAVLVLDEATSALDAEAERVVQAALERAARGRTVLVIAHRLSTVRAAHLIVVLQGGRVAEVGGAGGGVKAWGLQHRGASRGAQRCQATSRPLSTGSAAVGPGGGQNCCRIVLVPAGKGALCQPCPALRGPAGSRSPAPLGALWGPAPVPLSQGRR